MRCAAVTSGLCVLALAPAAGAADQRIAAGVSAGGVDVSALTVAEAAARLREQLAPRIETQLIIGVAGRQWKLPAATAKLRLDTDRTAKRALYAKAGTTQVEPAITHSRTAVRTFVDEVARRVRKPARDAEVRITLRHVTRTHSHKGLGLAVTTARRQIDAAFDDPAAPRLLHRALTVVKPKVDADDIGRLYNTVVTVDKAHFKLRLFKGLKFRKSYGVAVGQPAYPTPSGRFSITSKAVNPTWSVPNSPWAGELQGTVVDGGSAANPLKARWMGIANGVGIHGTGEDWSIGTRASHGCIRMHVGDVVDLFKRVPVGTAVLLK